MNPHMTVAELAKALGKSEAWVNERIGPATIVCTCYAHGADCCRVHRKFLEDFYNYGTTCSNDSLQNS